MTTKRPQCLFLELNSRLSTTPLIVTQVVSSTKTRVKNVWELAITYTRPWDVSISKITLSRSLVYYIDAWVGDQVGQKLSWVGLYGPCGGGGVEGVRIGVVEPKAKIWVRRKSKMNGRRLPMKRLLIV
uniref:Uncharacterized protein n=1 Tax=Hyaloperonospora arabidopsidis (strain Emoy2) TaxID=559515 RepID=M4BQY2_HYAAE